MTYKRRGALASYPKSLPTDISVSRLFLCSVDDRGYPKRKLTFETLEHFGVKTWMCGEVDEIDYLAFPITKKGKVEGYILRKEAFKDKAEKWCYIGEYGVRHELSGQFVCTPSKHKHLIVCEGQLDYLCLYQCLHEANYLDGYDVVSLGYGVGNAEDHLEHNRAFFSQYDKVITCFDADCCTSAELRKGLLRGREATAIVQQMLMNKGCVVELDDDMDVGDYILADREKDLLVSVLDAEPFLTEGVINASNVSLKRLVEPIRKGIALPSFPSLSKRLGGLRENELTLLLAPPKSGKTLVTGQIVLDLLRAGEGVFLASLEESTIKTLQRLVAMQADVNHALFREKPEDLDPYCVYQGQRTLSRLKLFDSVAEELTPDNILRMMIWLHKCHGVQWFVIDHMSDVVASCGSENERMLIDGLLRGLGRFTRECPVHVLCVSHITIDKGRWASAMNAAKLDKKDEMPCKPFWYRVNEYDGRGSGAFAHVPSNVIGIDKCVNPNGSLRCTQLSLLLCREHGRQQGKADKLVMQEDEGYLRAFGENDYI